MHELRALIRAGEDALAAGEEVALATVVRVQGSAYRRPGARMLIRADGSFVGSISGGCLEAEIARRAFWRTEQGATVTRHDLSGELEEGHRGVGCDGTVDVLLERLRGHPEGAPRLDPLSFAKRCWARQEQGVMATVLASDGDQLPVGARIYTSPTLFAAPELSARARGEVVRACEQAGGAAAIARVFLDAGEVELFVEPVVSPIRLFVLGARHDAVPLVDLARGLGWEVIVWERRAQPATRRSMGGAAELAYGPVEDLAMRVDESQRAACVTMAHDYEQDRASLRMLLATRARYIGVLGPARRTLRMLAEIDARERARDPRLFAPVGLALGAETPAEVAVAIVAEIQGVMARAPRVSLRSLPGAIHDAGPPNVAAIVLAAGASSRLGRPKQLVRIRGRSLIRHVVEQAGASRCDQTFVVVGERDGEIARTLEDTDARCLVNPAWPEGMAGSIRVGVAQAARAGFDAVVLLACDQPSISAAHIDRLVAEHRRTGCAVGSAYASVVGVPAIFGRDAFPALLALEGDAGARQLLRASSLANPVRAIEWPQGASDIDTPEDLEQLGS